MKPGNLGCKVLIPADVCLEDEEVFLRTSFDRKEVFYLFRRSYMKHYFSSESVSSGHPDKICDQIADTILDEALKADPYSHMAVEASIKDNFILLFGEADTKAEPDYADIARRVIKDIGYEGEFEVLEKISKQSHEIHDAVGDEKVKAGDQGIMFGYACDETEEYMPLPIALAHRSMKRFDEYRKEVPGIFQPDGKSQVTVEYEGNEPVRIDTVVLSASHYEDVSLEKVREIVKKEIIDQVLPKEYLDEKTKYLINPGGSFTVCGPFGDSGTTGRKIVVDTYGGMGRIGGGCFSSKDPSKVDRSAAYYTRYAARSLVASGLCRRCEIQVSYAIGQEDALSVFVDTFGTGRVDDDKMIMIIKKNFDFSAAHIIEELDLRRPIYQETVNYGHFGRKGLPWEKNKKLKV